MNKKKSFLPIIIALLIAAIINSTVRCADAQGAAKDKKSLPKPIFSPLVGRLILGAFAVEMCYFTGDHETQTILLEQLYPTRILTNCASEYGTYVLTNLAHEAGHAFAAKYFNNDDIDIHIGGNSTDSNNPLFASKNLSINGFDPLAGHTIFTKPRQQGHTLDREKYAVILLAGSFAGILCNIILKTGTSLFQTGKLPAASSLAFDPITLLQLFNILIPFTTETSASSDAAKLYLECLQIPKQTIDLISKLGIPLIFLQELLLVEHQSSRKGTVALHSKALLALANTFLRGFARFRL